MPPPPPPPPSTGGFTDRQWAAIMHLSVLAGWPALVLGFAVPVGIYLALKDNHPAIRPHAYVVFNWILSLLIYGAICGVLALVLIGFVGFWILGVVSVIYAILGAVRALDGELWEYPGSIRFLS